MTELNHKQKLAVYAPSAKFGLRDLQSVDFFRILEDRYNITWLFAGDVPAELKSELKNIELIEQVALNPRRYRFWLYDHVLTRYDFDRKHICSSMSYPKIGLSKITRKFIQFLIDTKLSRLAQPALRYVYQCSAPRPPICLKYASAMLAIGSPKDAILDDLLRAAEKQKIKTALLITNWDGATSKPLIKKPDMILTWGQQTAQLAEKIHGIRALPVGCARFDHYREAEHLEKAKAKEILALDQDKKYLLFAGAGLPFIEPKVLSLLANTIRKFSQGNIKLLYRPHPESWLNHTSESILEDVRDIVEMDPTLQKYTNDDMSQYPVLFSAIDGLISPFSTMIVEAAFFNIPTLCVAFDDPAHTEFDWVLNAKTQPHLKIINDSDWTNTCYDLQELPDAVEQLLKDIDKAIPGDKGKQLFASVVHSDEQPFIKRLSQFIEEHLN